MAVNTSKKALEDMVKLINDSTKKIFELNDELTNFMNTVNWKDDKGTNFFKEMKAMQTKLLEPVPQLKKTRDFVQGKIKVVEKYNKVSF